MRKFKIKVITISGYCEFIFHALNGAIALTNFLELYPQFEENEIIVFPM